MTTLAPEIKIISTFEREITQIVGFYNLDPKAVLGALKPLEDHFQHYWEMVFSKSSFEIITAGDGEDISHKVLETAVANGVPERVCTLFKKCTEEFPWAISGIKLCFSPEGNPEPTLYVRTKCQIEDGLRFLREHIGAEEAGLLEGALKESKTLYGLGFSTKNGQPYSKTYTINTVKDDRGMALPGFISHRLAGNDLSTEHKEYLPDVCLENFRTNEKGVNDFCDFLYGEMNYKKAGHIGLQYVNGVPAEYKIYIERRGGIPTDFSAR